MKDLEQEINQFAAANGSNKLLIRTIQFLRAELYKQDHMNKKYVECIRNMLETDRELLDNEIVSNLLMDIISMDTEAMEKLKGVLIAAAPTSSSNTLLTFVAKLHLESSEFKAAEAILLKLVKNSPDDKGLLRKYIFAKSFVDPIGAEGLLKQLPKIDCITDASMLNRLENEALSLRSKKAIAGSGPVSLAPEMERNTKKIKKIKRRVRYPKGFDPENPGPPPDPERWLPKHQRSKYRKKGKGKGLLRGPQGGDAGKETMNTFQTGPSTATQDIAQEKAKPRKKKGKH
jgi:signal recognition particle subunit SRP72